MAKDNNIQHFTAADIEKYHKGQLSPSQMHAMEKAALDDPFLADAMEGYSLEGLDVPADIIELKKRLAEKEDDKVRVVPMKSRTVKFQWFRIAAMIVVLAGAGILSYQLLFKSSNEDIALSEPGEKQEENKAPTPANTEQDTSSSPDRNGNKPGDDASTGNAAVPGKKSVTAPKGTVTDEQATAAEINQETKDIKPLAPVTSAAEESIATAANEKEKVNDLELQRQSDIVQKAEVDKKKEAFAKTSAGTEKDQLAKPGYQVAPNTRVQNNRSDVSNKTPNFFRGQVTDANNNPLPFANIINTTDNVGTYTDAKGNFTLVSPADSIMNVQVKALGFENNRMQLRSDVSTNQIRLQEDRSITARVLDTVKRNYAIRSRDAALTFEEPEPADGWASYDSYLANNLSDIPEAYDSKKNTGGDAVEISFEVNKFGEPVNIRVEKSLCDKCDKEAIRLVKAGPKWKRKAKKGKRTTVTVPFTRTD